MEQTELIKKCQLDDFESFNELYGLYSRKAFKTAYFISGNKELAEDIVQEAFTRCFMEIKKLKNPELFNRWFYSLLVRVGWRVSAKQKNVLSKELHSEEIELIKSSENTEDLIEKKEIHKKVNEALQTLNLTLRTTVILHYYNDLSIKDISKIMDCFQGTVKSRLHTARKLIGKKLEKYINEDFSGADSFKKECLVNE
jgi:RNA polymerase sigma-70 factor (ECF subfamily)